MHPFLNIAKRAALSAGKIMLRHLDRLDRLQVSSKQHNDFVTEVDLQAEQEIIQQLRRIYPDHGILAEESGISVPDADYQWVIDPLDGTNNYLRGLPHFAVSLGLRYKGRLEAGLIYDPVKQEMFTATRGQGALLNDRRIRVRAHNGLDGALIATAIPAPKHAEHGATYLGMIGALIDGGAQVRRTGSAALDLAYVAAGRLDGVCELGLKPWDIAAGAVIAQEAGALLSDFSGGHTFYDSGNIVAAPPKVLKGIVQTLQPQLSPALTR